MPTPRIRSEDAPEYGDRPNLSAADREDIAAALRILKRIMRPKGAVYTSPRAVKDYCLLQFADLQQEVFGCMFMDARHRLIGFQEVFRGTLDGASVYPREVVKAALRVNAGAVILAHNHPSGDPTPSTADVAITLRLRDALAMVDIRVLDHIVVGGTEAVSLAELGRI